MQDGGARYAIPTDDAHLDPAATGGTRDNRNDGVLWKDDVLDRLVRLSEHVAPLQLDHLKVRLDEGQIVRRERQQQGVADDGRLGVADDGQMRRLRHGSPGVLGRKYASLSAACAQIILQAIDEISNEQPQKTRSDNQFSLCDVRRFSASAIQHAALSSAQRS